MGGGRSLPVRQGRVFPLGSELGAYCVGRFMDTILKIFSIGGTMLARPTISYTYNYFIQIQVMLSYPRFYTDRELFRGC